MKKTIWYTVYMQYPNGRRVEIAIFENKKTATTYAKRCANEYQGNGETTIFEVGKVELLESFAKEAK